MHYLHEHTLLGNYGHLLLIVAFVAALLAGVSYLRALKPGAWQNSRRLTGKGFFLVSCVSAMAAIGILYYLMLNRYFEFHYVWKYTNHAMNSAYMLASFWSGQEGSLLLWSFWILVFSAKVQKMGNHSDAGGKSGAGIYFFNAARRSPW